MAEAIVDIRRIVKAMRYSQLEQRGDPDTGERMVPPSIKFAVFLTLVVVAGALLYVGATQLEAPGGDAGSVLDEPDGGGSGNNTTEESPAAMADGAPGEPKGPVTGPERAAL
jgi:hypothetical protein